MSLTIHFLCENGVLYATVTGVYSFEEVKRCTDEMLAEVAEHRIDKVLVDGRTVVGKVEEMERYHYGEYLARKVFELVSKGTCPTPHLAYVLLPPISDPGRFGETVAVNRGVIHRVFEEIEDAQNWLGIGPGSALLEMV